MLDTTQGSQTPKTFNSILDRHISFREVIFIGTALLCLHPQVSPPTALLLGLVLAQCIGHPYLHLNAKASHFLLQVSIVGLGFGINLSQALKAGKTGVGLTMLSISSVLLLGIFIGKIAKIDKKVAYLISVGTAICGGSAIAAVSPAIKAEEKQVSIALGTIFILNAIALFAFPAIGHCLNLSQSQFGLWCAIAIHDTSSVVGAASKYGQNALEIATTVKLLRAIWIIPLVLLSSMLFKNKDRKIKVPYFIGWFALAVMVNTYSPAMKQYGHYLVSFAKSGLALSLFLIGSGLSYSALKSVGFRPLLQGAVLWVCVSGLSLWGICLLAN